MEEVIKSYLENMPFGHVFDLSYRQMADLFPPGAGDAAARQKLAALAEECDCDVTYVNAEDRVELTRR
jgi:hypothetical protein